jgi:hypothetical protein
LRTRPERPYSRRAAEQSDELAPRQLIELHPVTGRLDRFFRIIQFCNGQLGGGDF